MECPSDNGTSMPGKSTHGLFTGTLWRQLWSVGVREIHCTDSVPLPPKVRSSRIRVIPIIASAASALRTGTRPSPAA